MYDLREDHSNPNRRPQRNSPKQLTHKMLTDDVENANGTN